MLDKESNATECIRPPKVDDIEAYIIDSSEQVAPDILERLLPDTEVVVLPQVDCSNEKLVYKAVKRIFDITSSLTALVILALPMMIIAIRVKRESEGPVIYAQTRVGKNGKLFKLYKFRSMYVDAEARGAQWAAGDDPRVTSLGRILRNSRLDELPQFWNVVKGDMSLIGPRPERPVFHNIFKQRIIGWEQRLFVRPGITGLAQIKGGYDLLPKEKARYDIEYINHQSIPLDLQIIIKTLGVMKTGEGAR